MCILGSKDCFSSIFASSISRCGSSLVGRAPVSLTGPTTVWEIVGGLTVVVDIFVEEVVI